MSYGPFPCREYFTNQQGVRMRNAILSYQILQNALLDNCCIGDTLDLYIKDKLEDNGNDAGYNWNWDLDNSPDIWVRNQNDGFLNQVHENPEYQSGQPVYVYVRVGNKSCVPSLGTEKLVLFWSKASTNSSWPQNWNGSVPTTGDTLGSEFIPILQPGESVVLEFEWNIIPSSGIGTNWNSCLLARIENSLEDAITAYPSELGQEVYSNNNIAMRNCVVTNYLSGLDSGGSANEYLEREQWFFVGNSTEEETSFDLIFHPVLDQGNLITEVAEVSVEVATEEDWNLLYPILEANNRIEIKENSTFRILGNTPLVLENISFPGSKRVQLKLRFNFLIDEVDQIDQYKYRVLQKRTISNISTESHWTGGVHFTINKGPRSLFEAYAGEDLEIDKGDSVTITAEQINESAKYYWYNSEGVLIYTGSSLTVSPEITKAYRLEVVTDADGFKDYDEVEIKVNDFEVSNLLPNPAQSQLTVEYKTMSGSSSYLMVFDERNNYLVNNYIVNSDGAQITLDLQSYPSGNYIIALVVNGQIVDAKTLIKQ